MPTHQDSTPTAQALNLANLTNTFADDDKAREFLESVRWPDGPICPKCGVVNDATKLTPRADSKSPVRNGVYQCNGKECRAQFTVTVGSIFEDSHLPLRKWLMGFHLMCASKKGMSAHQLHRMLGTTYRTAWFMAHRIRHAMGQPEPFEKLKGTVECDETYVGGKPRKGGKPGRPSLMNPKQPVFSLVERDGRVRSFHMRRVTEENLLPIMKENIAQHSIVMTDDFGSYRNVKKVYPMHCTIQHTSGVYSKPGPWGRVHTNTIEGYFGILKRGVIGTYHHVGEQHLFRYLAEFDFRYNARKVKDGERTLMALKGAEGKRLRLAAPSNLDGIPW